MDVNGTRHHLVLTESEWTRAMIPGRGVAWNADRDAVTLTPLVFRFPSPERTTAVARDRRRGADADRYGNWYWLDEDEKGAAVIRFRGHSSKRTETFWPRPELAPNPAHGDFSDAVPSAAMPRRLRGLAVTTDHYLVVGALDLPGLLIFDLHGVGPPYALAWPSGVPFAPFDLARRACGGVFVLDVEDDGTARYWALDERWQVVPTGTSTIQLAPSRPADFRPVGDPPRMTPAMDFAAGIDLSLASPLGVTSPVAIEGLPDGSVLVLESGTDYSVVHRFDGSAVVGAPLALDRALENRLPPGARAGALHPFAVLGLDFAFVAAADAGWRQGAPVRGTLFITSVEGDQSYAFVISDGSPWSLTLSERYFPMRSFTGRALSRWGSAAFYDVVDRFVPLTAVPKPRFESTGAFELARIDSQIPSCVWHRLLLDACIPPGASVEVESRAADDPTVLDGQPFEREPRLYARPTGSELPFEAARSTTWELLFQRANGRYLDVRLVLSGTGRNTPELGAARLHYPRFSYLAEYLPDAYRDDPTSASFFDRYLANPEGMLTALEGRIAEAQRLFDVRTVPAQYLEWLASWLGVIVDPAWEEARQRLFLRHAPQLFRERGTVRGLERLLRLAIDPCAGDAIFTNTRPGVVRGVPRVREQFLARDHRGLHRLLAPSDDLPYGPAGPTWVPADGGAVLHERYRAFVLERYAGLAGLAVAWERSVASAVDVVFSALAPSGATEAADWRAFAKIAFGFPYVAAVSQDVSAYQAFVARRHGSIEALDDAYGLLGADRHQSFAELELPSVFPKDGAPLTDWIDFVSVVLPISRSAHRFVVLVPAFPGERDDVLAARLARVAAVVRTERPAHTDFDVRMFWDVFRVGEVQVGIDAEIGMGARLFATVLDESHFGESFLAEAHPGAERDRVIVGRDRHGALPPI